ncbi:MAG: hypothetical protein AB7P69_01210 [Candidatus Binatia bacterium]
MTAGVHVIFKAGDPNGLYEAFHVDRAQKLDAANLKVATQSLAIACDALEIHGELSLPECHVTLYARTLAFVNNGAINTSPLPWSLAKAADANPQTRASGQDGAHGRHAGNLTVFVDHITTPEDESRTRFIARGGRGQDAGLGKSGQNGVSMPSYTEQQFTLNDSNIKTTYCKATFNPPAVYIACEWWWGLNKWSGGDLGAHKWPGDGGAGRSW